MSADTIAAVATPAGEGAIAVVRVSGPGAFAIGRALGALEADVRSHVARVRTLRDASGGALDQALVLPFAGPASFTGEDVLELHCHGGALTPRRVLDAVLVAGARTAEPGEFSRQALLNGKLDVVQVEAIADVIHAQSEAAHRLAQGHLAGRLSREIDAIKGQLAELITLVEAAIDFSLEEHVYTITGAEIAGRLEPAMQSVRGLLATYDAGRMAREGVRVAIVGAPNAGKSTLLNGLLRDERAIVTDIAGTTRDTIEEALSLGGQRYVLTDTAGIRETDDAVEAIGVARSRRALAAADVALVLVDATEAPGELVALPEVPWALVLNKMDAAAAGQAGVWRAWAESACASSPPTSVVEASLLRGDVSGVESALEALSASLGGGRNAESVLLSRARHRDLLEASLASLERALEASLAELGHELVALDLRAALDLVGSMTGAVTTDDVLNRIFAGFCIGK